MIFMKKMEAFCELALIQMMTEYQITTVKTIIKGKYQTELKERIQKLSGMKQNIEKSKVFQKWFAEQQQETPIIYG